MHGQVFNVYVSCIYTCCPSGILTLKTTFEKKGKEVQKGVSTIGNKKENLGRVGINKTSYLTEMIEARRKENVCKPNYNGGSRMFNEEK